MKKKEEKIEKYFSNTTDDQLASDAEKADYSFYKHVDPKNDRLSLATPKETYISEESEYLRFFHDVVLTGIACGLDHPVEWIINAHRTPGGSLTQECYQEIEKHTPRFLVEIFENLYLRRPNNATEVLEMCNDHYPEGHLCRDFFNFLKTDIERYLRRQKMENKERAPMTLKEKYQTEPWSDLLPEKEGRSKESDSSIEEMGANPGRCIFCGKENPDTMLSPGTFYHSSCLSCPQCGESEMIIWKGTKPYMARCLMCLHKWALLKEQETT